jgi:sulfide:quinone oxidoreductase
VAKVLVLGGGFGGLAAAHELRALLGDDHEITLIDRNDRFYMGFAKLWDLGGVRPLADGTAALSRLEARGIHFLQTTITAIDPEARTVATAEGRLPADALLVALGAGPSAAHLDLLAGEGAHDLYDGDALPAMRRDIAAVDSGRVVVSILGGPFKCPPAPYEAALIVDELLRGRGVRDAVEVVVTTPQPITLPAAGPDASRYVADHLVERGVELLAEHPVKAVDGSARRITFANGTTLDYAVLLGVPANVPPPVVRESALAGESGWIEPDKRTFRTRFDHVYAVGDCTLVPNVKGQLPKAGVFAAAEGRVAANNIAVDLIGGTESVFDGHGYCFLELPGRKVAYVEGNFLAEPDLDVHITEASEEQFARKQAFERDLLDAWLGA